MTHFQFFQRLQVTQDVPPLKLPSSPLQPFCKLVHEEESEKTREQVSGNRQVGLVEGRARVKK